MEDEKIVDVEDKDIESDAVQAESSESGANKSAKSGGAADNDELLKKIVCALGYFYGILFFLPLLIFPDDAFARKHANQGLVLLLAAVIGNVVCGILLLVPIVGLILFAVYNVLIFVLSVIGIVYALTGNDKDLPIFGKIRIIK